MCAIVIVMFKNSKWVDLEIIDYSYTDNRQSSEKNSQKFQRRKFVN